MSTSPEKPTQHTEQWESIFGHPVPHKPAEKRTASPTPREVFTWFVILPVGVFITGYILVNIAVHTIIPGLK